MGPDHGETIFFLFGGSWGDALSTSPAGIAHFILAHACVTAEINVVNGTSTPPEALEALVGAGDLFALYTPTYVLAGGKQSCIRRRILELAGLLDMYNNGRIGPGHFTEDSGSTLRSPKTLPAAGRRETKK